MKRLFSLVLLCCATALSGCKEPPSGSVEKASSSVVRAGQDIVVKSVHTYTPTDSVAGSNDVYYVVELNFTNHLGVAISPQINHFVIEDTDKRRYLGVETGSTVLVGISNSRDVLKVGDAHDYTVGFRVPIGTQGTLFYDATF